MAKRKRTSGFTLVELLVATVIGMFVAIVAVGSLHAVSGSAKLVELNATSADDLRFAAETMRRDMMNIYRDIDFNYMRFVGDIDVYEDSTSSKIVFYGIKRTQLRRGLPESDVCEIEYMLLRRDDTTVLTRRIWPNPDKESEPGGILSVLAEDVVLFDIQYYDGQQWLKTWPEDMEKLCDLIAVSIAANTEAGVVKQTFMVDLSGAKAGTGTSGLFESEEAEEGEGSATPGQPGM